MKFVPSNQTGTRLIGCIVVYGETYITSASSIDECNFRILELSQQPEIKERLYFIHNVFKTVN